MTTPTPEERAIWREGTFEVIEHARQKGSQVDWAEAMIRLLDALEAAEGDRDAWRDALISLTPGGGRYLTPHACRTYVERCEQERHDASLVSIRIRRDLRARLAQAEADVRTVLRYTRSLEWPGEEGEAEIAVCDACGESIEPDSYNESCAVCTIRARYAPDAEGGNDD